MNKKMKILLAGLGALVLFASPLRAIDDHVEISELPGYTKTDNFELSYSAFSEGSVSVEFFYKKDGESYTKFGPTKTTPSGKVEVTGDQVKDQAKYFFKVELNGGTDSDETSVIYDVSGPDAVKDYEKQVLGENHIRLNWRNPDNDDFYKVIIYRSTSSEFTADDNTKVADIVGPRDGEMSWEDAGQESGKTYYYAIRAVDAAGNGSSLVSDVEATVLGTSTDGTGVESGVTTLPVESSGGQVLGEGDEGDSAEGEASEGVDGETEEINLGLQEEELDGTALRRILWTIGVVVVVYALWRFFFRRRE